MYLDLHAVLVCAGSGVNKITDDFGADFNSEFPIRTGTSPSNRYLLFALVTKKIILKPTQLCYPCSKSA